MYQRKIVRTSKNARIKRINKHIRVRSTVGRATREPARNMLVSWL